MFTSPQLLFGGEVRLPDLLVILHTREGVKYNVHPAVGDAAKGGVPTVAVVDSDCNPNIVTYPVPGNDDTPQATQLYLSLFKQAIMLGKRYRRQKLKEASDEEQSGEESETECV